MIVPVLGWTLWHGVGIYNAGGPTRLGGQMYAATAYETEADCHAACGNGERGAASPRSAGGDVLGRDRGVGS
jgi:hypothetical protein